MLKKERHQLILDELNQCQKIISAALCVKLGTSEDTIRRDLNELAGAGQLVKVHGGALPIPQATDNTQQKAMALVTEGLQMLLANGNTQTVKVFVLSFDLPAGH